VTEPVRGPFEQAIVQTSSDMVTWTTQPDVEFLAYSEGQGEIIGSANFRLHWGSIVRAGASAVATITDPAGLGGLLVRVCREDATGSITYASLLFKEVWWGKMLAPDTGTTGGNGTTNYTAAGIAGLFHERSCWVGRALIKTGPVLLAIAFELAPFNAWPSGDRSASTTTVGGVSVYVHDATAPASGNLWTARQIIDNLMACNFRVEHPPTVDGSGQSGLSWAISDPQSCLAYTPERFEARDKTIGSVLNDLCGKSRGLTWWVTVSGTTLTVNVASGLATAVTVGSTTIPANPAIWDQLDDADPFIHPMIIREVTDEVADEIIIKGSPRTIGLTLAIYGTGDPFVADTNAQLGKGWSSAAETACNTFLDTINAPGRRAAYEHAWRRFVLRATGWNGNQYGGTGGMPWGLSTATDASYGADGYTGVVVEGLGGGEKPALWYKAMGDLPCAPGFTALNVGPRQPLVILAEDFDAGSWQDHSSTWTVWVEASPPAVVIDDGANGMEIRRILRDGRKILVSLALRDFFPFHVSWRRDPSEWPSVTPRTKTITMPDLTQSYLMNGMTTGVSSDAGGSLTTTASITTQDNLPQLRSVLAQARAWYSEPYQLATFTDRGIWDTDPAYRPGTILGNITDGVTPRVINAMVSRRTVKLEYAQGANGVQVPYWSTTWETDQVYPDIEAKL
jgi:hypothetical protein